MLGQSKTVFQAEIDAAVRAHRLLALQRALRPGAARRAAGQRPHDVESARVPRRSRGSSTRSRRSTSRRSPRNLPTAPALMGNTVVWKPASSAMFSALLPDEAVRSGRHAARRDQLRRRRRGDDLEGAARRTAISPACTSPAAPRSSTTCGRRSARRCPPTAPTRASSAKPAARTSSSRTRRPTPTALAVAIVRGGFEFQGQKCSAASRVYVPRSIWNEVRDRAVAMIDDIKMGDVQRLPELHGRGDRQARVRQDQRLHRPRARATRRSSPAARSDGSNGLLHQPDAGRDRRSRLPPAVRGDLRAGRHRATSTTMRSGRRR